jgi:hypothetical protein
MSALPYPTATPAALAGQMDAKDAKDTKDAFYTVGGCPVLVLPWADGAPLTPWLLTVDSRGVSYRLWVIGNPATVFAWCRQWGARYAAQRCEAIDETLTGEVEP